MTKLRAQIDKTRSRQKKTGAGLKSFSGGSYLQKIKGRKWIENILEAV